MIIYEVASFRRVIVQDLSTQARIIGRNCAAALEFDNPHTAQETLASLKARPDLVAACVYRRDGSVLASYPAGLGVSAKKFPHREANVHRIEDGNLVIFDQITRNGEVLGTVYLRSNMQPHYARLVAGIGIALGTMVVAAIVALALAARLQRVISNPILTLARVTEEVRNSSDYSLRAHKSGGDEIGLLTDGFNRMLEAIQERDSKLHRAYDDLRFSEQRFLQLAESIREVFWLTDPEKRTMLYVSPIYEQMWGRTCDSLYNNPRSWLEAIHPDNREHVRQAAQTKQIDGSYDEKYQILRPDGSVRWIRDRAFPILDEKGKVFRIAGIAEDITEQRESETKLRELASQLLCAQDEERRRIARELHDVTAQNLAALEIGLSRLDDSVAALNSEERQLIAQSLKLVNQCSEEVRTLSYLLHPPLLDEFGLTVAMKWFLDGLTQRTAIQVELDVPAELGRFPPEIEIALFRVLQESLINIHRHSGSSAAKIRLAREDGRIVLEIHDLGKGFLVDNVPGGAVSTAGVGILSMRERLKQLGGVLTLESGHGGTRVRAVLPIIGDAK
jgi:PAS domain S-box-containing protein